MLFQRFLKEMQLQLEVEIMAENVHHNTSHKNAFFKDRGKAIL